MAGFMKPGLGFSSTVGSFIKGAADKGTEMIDRERALDEQYNKIWIAKFSDGMKQYDQEQDRVRKEKGAYDFAVTASNGNKRMGDLAVSAYRANPNQNLQELVTNVIANNPDAAKPDNTPGLFESSINEGLNRKLSLLEQFRGQVKDPRALNTMVMPQMSEAGQTLNYGGGPPSGGTPGSTGGGGSGLSLGSGKITIPDLSKATDQEAAFKMIKAANPTISDARARDLANSSVTNDILHKQKKDEARERAGTGADLAGPKEFATKTMDAATKLPTPDISSIQELDQLVHLLDTGALKTGGPIQGMLDNIQRLIAPFGGSINTYTAELGPGWQANEPPTADALRKISSRLTLEAINAGKLAPVSNFEVNFAQGIIPNMYTSKQANIYIALIMKAALERQQAKREYVFKDWSKDNPIDAYEVNRRMNAFDIEQKKIPAVPYFNSAHIGAEKSKEFVNNLPMGTWYIDMSRGIESLAKKTRNIP